MRDPPDSSLGPLQGLADDGQVDGRSSAPGPSVPLLEHGVAYGFRARNVDLLFSASKAAVPTENSSDWSRTPVVILKINILENDVPIQYLYILHFCDCRRRGLGFAR
eukprot:7282084-Pyramimonas_sp.AAC.1